MAHSAPMRIGILALQGAVQPHRAKLQRLGVQPIPVKDAEELFTCRGLIVPGGESTTFLKLIHAYALWRPLLEFASTRPMWGVCAGSILMAKHVENPGQDSLGVLPITVRRNAYGRQNESFITRYDLRLPGGMQSKQEAVFIRAPVITAVEDGVVALAEHNGHPIVVQHGRHLAATFHPELSESDTLHSYFLNLCGEARQTAQAHA